LALLLAEVAYEAYVALRPVLLAVLLVGVARLDRAGAPPARVGVALASPPPLSPAPRGG